MYNWPQAVPKYRSFANATKFISNPIPILSRQLEQYGDSYTFYMGGMKKSIVTADADFVQHVLQKGHRKYQKSYIQTETLAEYIGRGLLTAEGPYWLKQRRLIQPGFHRNTLAGLTALMRDEIEATLDQWPVSDQPVNIYEMLNHLTFRIVARSLFSTDLDEHGLQELSDLITVVQEFIIREVRQPFFHWWFKMSGLIRKHIALAHNAQSIIQKVIDARRQAPSHADDLMNMLLAARYEDGSPMSDQQLIDESLILFVAGHETSANAMSWTLYLLCQYPEILEKLAAEISEVVGDKQINFEDISRLQYMRQVIEESMRLFPPAWVSDRVSIEDDEICGFSFPANTIVILYFYGLHHNPKYWDRPEEFNPDRFDPKFNKERHPFAYAPFGGGPRLCIGNHFAMMEMQLMLAEIVRRFNFTMEQKALDLQPLVTLRPRGGMFMRLKNRL